jgi:hypothetical protein
MRVIVAALIVGASLAQACQHPTSPPGKEPIKPGEKTAWNASNNISANSLFGRVQITAMQNMCAGRIQLEQGSATVRDACFTGDTTSCYAPIRLRRAQFDAPPVSAICNSAALAAI